MIHVQGGQAKPFGLISAAFGFIAWMASAPLASAAPCTFTPAATPDAGGLIIEATVLRSEGAMRGGQVLINADGKIGCVAKNCAPAGASPARLSCRSLVLSPGMINTHDHLNFAGVAPIAHPGALYVHRHEWRKGLNGHVSIEPPRSDDARLLAWGELRFLVGGVTSTIGGAMAPGLLRNLDFKAGLEGVNETPALYRTFPLGDADGTMQTSTCDYGPAPTTPADASGAAALIAHVAEGTGRAARNEFLCESSTIYDVTPSPRGGGVSYDWILPQAALIHAVALEKQDLRLVASRGSSLIWSPRSNFSLYGKTMRVGDAAALHINIALGADWLPSGSMNLNRELACASDYSARHLFHPLSDRTLWRMVTTNAARAAHVDDALGAIEPGKVADLILVSRRGANSFRAVTASTPQSVLMVMRGGVALYGDPTIVSALRSDCDPLQVAGVRRLLCTEAGRPSAGALQTYADSAALYPLAFKGRPSNEPACQTARPWIWTRRP